MTPGFLLLALAALLLLGMVFVDKDAARRFVVLPLLLGAGLTLVAVRFASDAAGY